MKRLVEAFWSAGKTVSAVCHGPCALVTAVGADGASILKGRRVAGFSNHEEAAVVSARGSTAELPSWLLCVHACCGAPLALLLTGHLAFPLVDPLISPTVHRARTRRCPSCWRTA